MFKKKIQFYYKTLIRLIFKIIYGSIIVDSNSDKLFDRYHIDKYSNDKCPDRKYFLYIAKKCRIYTDLNENVAIIKDNIILPELSFQQVDSKLENAKYNSVIKNGTPYIKKKIKGTILNLLQGSSGENYFHFMFDILPRIFIAKSFLNLNEIDYFLLNKKIEWQINILKIIGVSSKKIIDAKKFRHIDAEKLITVSHPWYNKGYIQNETINLPDWIVSELRKTFLVKSNKPEPNNLNLFIDRSESKYFHCKILNNEELTKFLQKKNFEILKPEKISLIEQIQKFNCAKTVIGAHGAGLTNIVFSKEKTNVIEIIPESHPSKKVERLSDILNLKYFRYKTEDTQYDKMYPFNIKVDIKKLENFLNTKI